MSQDIPICCCCQRIIILGPGELVWSCMNNGGCLDGKYCEICFHKIDSCAICRGSKACIVQNRHIRCSGDATFKCDDCDEEIRWDKAFEHEKWHVFEEVEKNAFKLLQKRKCYREDIDIVLAAVKQNGLVFKKLSENMKSKRLVALTAVQSNGFVLHDLPLSLQKEEAIAVEAVKSNWRVLKKIMMCHSTNPRVVIQGVAQNSRALLHADESLRKNPLFIVEAIKFYPNCIRYADKSLQCNRELFLLAVVKDTTGLIFRDLASNDAKSDVEIVIAALKNNGMMLEFVDHSLKRNLNIVRIAVCQNPYSIEFSDIKNSEILFSQVVSIDGCLLRYGDLSIRKNRNIVLAAVTQKGDALQYAHSSLRKDRQVVLRAVKSFPFAIEWADESLRKDPSILYQVALENHAALQHANRDFMLSLLQDAMAKKSGKNKRKRGSSNFDCVGDNHIHCRCGGPRKCYTRCERCGHYNHVRKLQCAFCAIEDSDNNEIVREINL